MHHTEPRAEPQCAEIAGTWGFAMAQRGACVLRGTPITDVATGREPPQGQAAGDRPTEKRRDLLTHGPRPAASGYDFLWFTHGTSPCV